jgi:hypothetical protein
MATPHQVQSGEYFYTVVEDCTIVYRVLIVGSITDEAFAASLLERFTVTADPALPVRATQTGLYALTGYAEQVFPQLSTTGYTVKLSFTAPSFRDATLDVPIPVNSTFPVTAAGVVLQRIPLRIQGRVVADTALRLPIAGALVLTVDGPSMPPGIHATALRTPLYAPHLLGATVQQLSLTAFDSTNLTQNTLPGATTLTLAKTTGLAANSILRLANLAQTIVEYCVVSSLGPDAGQLSLRHPLNRSYLSGAATDVQFVSAGAPTATATLTSAASAQDGLLLASQLFTGDTVAVDPGSPSGEYHEVGALTASDGYYSLDGIGRIRTLSLEASHTGFTNLTQDWSLAFDQPVNIVDFRLQP